MKAFLNTLRIITIIILSFYLLHKVSRYFYSDICDKKFSTFILKNKDFLKLEKRDTIYVADATFLECGNDPRMFINRNITRPAIEKELEDLGYSSIIFITDNPNINSDYIKIKKPCYRIHNWTDMYQIIPHYEILIQESYYNGESTICFESRYGYSFWGADEPDIKQIDYMH